MGNSIRINLGERMKENINLYKFDELDSTNDYLRRNHKSHEEFDVISARTQTHGKARRQNDWVSMDGMAIFSFFLKERDDWGIENYLKLPLIAGLATINGLNKIENLIKSYNLEKYFENSNIYELDKHKILSILETRLGISKADEHDYSIVSKRLLKDYRMGKIGKFFLEVF